MNGNHEVTSLDYSTEQELLGSFDYLSYDKVDIDLVIAGIELFRENFSDQLLLYVKNELSFFEKENNKLQSSNYSKEVKDKFSNDFLKLKTYIRNNLSHLNFDC